MSFVDSVTNFLGGSIFKEVKDLVTTYLPPDLTAEQKVDFELKMKELEQRKIAEMATIANTQLQLELSDTQDARAQNKLSIMPAVITVMLTLMACALLGAIIFVDLKTGSKELAFTLFGSVFALWGSSIQYWVGTTRGSQTKDQIIAQSDPIK
jgi:hypothetical protein